MSPPDCITEQTQPLYGGRFVSLFHLWLETVDVFVSILTLPYGWLCNHLLYIVNCAIKQNCVPRVLFGDLKFPSSITVVILRSHAVQTYKGIGGREDVFGMGLGMLLGQLTALWEMAGHCG